MPQVQDEGDGGAAGPFADSPGGIPDHPEGLIARASGWLLPIGTLYGVALKRITLPELTWDRLTIDRMQLSRISALMLVQGIQLNKLFPPDLTLFDGVQAELWFRAPPLLLRREETHLFQVPPKVEGLVIGVVVRAKGLSEEQIRAAMLESVLG